MFELKAYLDDRLCAINRELAKRLPADNEKPAVLHSAMRYSLLSGGKRLRPILVIAAAEAVGGSIESAIEPALAIEVLHTYTLIHDDLPCMDNDNLRRGRPTLHKVYGEANALLAGDALLTLAFEWLASARAPDPYPPNQLSLELAQAAGSRGVIGGQVEDIAGTGSTTTPAQLEYIHSHKTGMLIRAAVRIGAIVAGASGKDLAAITEYGTITGLAFQIADDILNAMSTPEALGKPVGSDKAHGKTTWVSVHGLDAARNKAAQLAGLADNSIACLGGKADPLRAIARYMVERKH
ncbi:MAG: polyprenyl synthetase family protein [bacterium]